MIGLALVGGCTDATGGVATPSGSGGSNGSSTSTTSSGGVSPTVQIPPRPKDLPLGGVQPCSLFTKAQLSQLKITEQPSPKTGSGHFTGLACDLEISTLDTFRSYEVVAITNEGIGAWLTGKRNVEAKLAEVAGYPAATYWFRGAEGTKTIDCATSVDVADGQQLMVTADNDSKHSFTLDQLCQMAETAAGMAVQTLQSLK
jgi:Protein of unknown function (DUF3558)